MGEPLQNSQRAEAGRLLFRACEAAVGVREPTALARVLGSTPSWWSRLRSGKGGFPEWPELEAVLPPELSADARELLEDAYVEALCIRHGVGEARRRKRAPLDFGNACAVRDRANRRWIPGDYRGGLRMLKNLGDLLEASTLEASERDDCGLRGDVLSSIGTCYGRLGDYPAAVLAGEKAVRTFVCGGLELSAGFARHSVAIARADQGDPPEAERELARLAPLYLAWRLPGERLRALQDRAMVFARAGQMPIAERQLIELYADTDWRTIRPAHHYQHLLKLAEVSLEVGKAGAARRWFTHAESVAAAHARVLAEHLERAHVIEDRGRLAQRLGM